MRGLRFDSDCCRGRGPISRRNWKHRCTRETAICMRLSRLFQLKSLRRTASHDPSSSQQPLGWIGTSSTHAEKKMLASFTGQTNGPTCSIPTPAFLLGVRGIDGSTMAPRALGCCPPPCPGALPVALLSIAVGHGGDEWPRTAMGGTVLFTRKQDLGRASTPGMGCLRRVPTLSTTPKNNSSHGAPN